MCRLGLTRKISKIALCAERKRKPSMFKLFVRPVFKAQAHDDTWYMEKKSTDLEVSFGSFCIARYSQSQFCQDITKRTGQSSFLARIWHFGHFIAFNSSLSRVTLSDQKCSQGKSNDVKWYNYQVIYQVYIYILDTRSIWCQSMPIPSWWFSVFEFFQYMGNLCSCTKVHLPWCSPSGDRVWSLSFSYKKDINMKHKICINL